MNADSRRLRRHLRAELRSAALYEALAEHADQEFRDVLLRLAHGERRHARHWIDVLKSHGADTDGLETESVSWRARTLVVLARLLGTRGVVPLLERGEAAELTRYQDEPHAFEGLVDDEVGHARMVSSLAPGWRARTASTLRAGVFGMSDGLVSNLSLVLGVSGANPDHSVVLLAGLAGLLAGALSMAVGEYVSVASQRELVLSGVEEADDSTAGSPLGAALASLLTFTLGALLPVLPYMVERGARALIGAVLLSSVALYSLGAGISLLTGRPAWRSGLRQLGLGLGAAAATYAIGTLLGVTLD